MNYRENPCCSTLARIGHAPALTLQRVLACAEPERRARLEAFIGGCFAERHGARIRHFLPDLLALSAADGRPCAAIGLRDAASGPLFLERYLDRPVEAEIAHAHGAPIARERIVEVGNLAALGSGHARLLIVALTDLLVAEGFEWVVFTATTEVSNSFNRLSLAPIVLGHANPARLGDERDDWGRYYDASPRVMAGAIRSGFESLATRGVFRQLGHQALYPARVEGAHAAVA